MKKLLILAIFLVILIIILSLLNISGVVKNTNDISLANSDTIYVNDDNNDGPWHGSLEHPYKTINDAVKKAIDGNTIYVFNGQYFENFTIYKSIDLIGENKGKTIIDGEYCKYIIHIMKDQVTVSNFTIRNSGGYKGNAGILVDSKNNVIQNCCFYRNRCAITIKNDRYCIVDSCTFHTNGKGVIFDSSSKCKLIDSCFYHNSIGLIIEGSDNIQIDNCYTNTCGTGIHINNSYGIDFKKCAIYDNNDNGGGLLIINSKDVDISNCNIVHNGFGLLTYDCYDVSVTSSDFIWNTHVGANIGKGSEEISIKNCEFTEQFRYGIEVNQGKCIFRNNNFYSNHFGMKAYEITVDARKNWWGSFFGPALIQRRIKDKIGFDKGFIRTIPWLPKKVENAGSDWEIDYEKYPKEISLTRFQQIKNSGDDDDGDFVSNRWEIKWDYDPNTWEDHANLDPDEDGLNNIEECYTDKWGSSPFKKDIFIEFNWMESKTSDISSNKPSEKYIDQMIEVFAEHDITLHMDDGRLGGGEMIPMKSEFYFPEVTDYYWDYFLKNDLNNPRKGIFHSCLIFDYGPEPGFPGYAVVGWDHLDGFEISGQRKKEEVPNKEKDYLIISVTMHELGHNLGLFVDDHGGIDNIIGSNPFSLDFLRYFRYPSIMNYFYTYQILDYSDGSHGKYDFNDWANLDFAFFKDTHFEWPKD